ncbi:MAG: hypothetical protein JST85_25320 [Acidobacteria bacterium]|nr:hypothetical protein [Acidobacteriota bacterium]
MGKRLLTMLIVLLVAANAVAAFAPSVSEREECSDACCVAEHCASTVELLPAALCCAINSQQDSEPNPAQSLPSAIQKQEIKTSTGIWASQIIVSYLHQTRFPSSPTRHLFGCSERYLENSSLLI